MKTFSLYKSLALVVLLAAFAPTSSNAQTYDQTFWDRLQVGTPVDGKPNCTWQWSQNTVGPWGGWYHSCSASQPLPEMPTPTVETGGHPCSAYNPYVDPVGMMACIAAHPVTAPPPSLPSIQPGRRYHLAYSSLQVQVLSVGTTLDGVQVVTYQWLVSVGGHDAGDVAACRNDTTGSQTTCAPFIPMQ